jgi:hypothetical protein
MHKSEQCAEASFGRYLKDTVTFITFIHIRIPVDPLNTRFIFVVSSPLDGYRYLWCVRNPSEIFTFFLQMYGLFGFD